MNNSENNSEHKIIKDNNKNLIVCFGGMAQQFGQIPPFEFLNHLSKNCSENCDLIFYVDKNQCWYHKGINNITTNINDTIVYLNKITTQKNYNKVIFMGISAGGYASILFGSLCNKVTNVISFVPQTILKNPIDLKYKNIKSFINQKVYYTVYANLNVTDINNVHHSSHCENIDHFNNVKVIKKNGINIKQYRDDGLFLNLINDIIN